MARISESDMKKLARQDESVRLLVDAIKWESFRNGMTVKDMMGLIRSQIGE